MVYIPRRVKRMLPNEQADENPACALADLREVAAWVLLGEPGAGKSSVFEVEAADTDGIWISIAKFLSDNPNPEWQGKTLFLDGLDETRASGGDVGVLLKVRAHLKKLRNPKFRIACRAADWFGETDSQAVSDVSLDGHLEIYVLEPLGEREIYEILSRNHGVSDPEAFVDEARNRRIDGLLYNPQMLRLLAESISDGQWPNTREETFQLACRKLAEENSKPHRDHLRAQALPLNKILDAAGQLCAVLLLSDKTGVALDQVGAGEEFPYLGDFSPGDLAAASMAARRKLFRPALEGEEQIVPSHRSVAEYLAARWLAMQIDDCGLPLRRVMNLFIGRDGRTVAGLRGLYAWLALHCQAARQHLIEADPLTVVIYGDVKPMSLTDKRMLLAGLAREARQHLAFRWEIPSALPFGALAEKELVPEFTAVLGDTVRDDASQSFADCILDILSEGEAIPELMPVIKAVVVDDSRWSVVRRDALALWLTMLPPTEEALALLNSINEGRLADSDDELAGNLLTQLYPEHIAPEQLLRYLHASRQRDYIGRYMMFWAHELPRLAPESHLPILLDQLVMRSDLVSTDNVTYSFDVRQMVGALLSRGIEVHGDAVSNERLYAWLGVDADRYGESRREKEHEERIAAWFEKRADRYRAVLGLCYEHCAESENIFPCLHTQTRRLRSVTAPSDIGIWHLDQASQMTSDALAENHLLEAVRALMFGRGDQGLTLEKIEGWAFANPARKNWLEPMLYWEIPDWRSEDAARKKARQVERVELRRKRSIELAKHLGAIREGRARAGILHELANVWMKRFFDILGDTPAERFDDYCETGEEVLMAVEAGFFLCPLREDLPSVQEIIDLSVKQREHSIRQPCLIGMELRWQRGAGFVDTLDDACLGRMVAFRLTYGADATPAWFTHLVEVRPALVASVLVDYVGSTLKAKRDFISGSDALAYDPAYGGVAKLAVPPLLAGFPVRAKATQLSHLENLLKAALRYSTTELAGLIVDKLTLKGMDVAQKVYWLTTAMLLNPPRYESVLWQYIGQNWIRANHLCAFLDDRWHGISSDYTLSPSTLGKLIELLSPHAELERRSGMVTGEMQRGDLVRSMVTRLGALATDAAAQEIERLIGLPSLSKLKVALENARHQLLVKLRENAFHFSSLSSVAGILANREPANVADLAALAVDYFDQIADWIRNDHDDGFRIFWNVEGKKPSGKREENLCRDVLLTRLREHFRHFGVDCEPESDYANDKRADIELSFRDQFVLPIEIKRDDNRALWTALRSQLMAQYSRSPKASGYGIYVVLWFGQNDLPPAKDGGKKPISLEELRARLEAQLDPEERSRIFIQVLDVSWPGAKQ